MLLVSWAATRYAAFAAADVAAYIAKGTGAEITLLSVVAPRLGPLFWRERRHRDLLQDGYTITREAASRISRLGVKLTERVLLAADPSEAILGEIEKLGQARNLDTGVVLGDNSDIVFDNPFTQVLPPLHMPIMITNRQQLRRQGLGRHVQETRVQWSASQG